MWHSVCEYAHHLPKMDDLPSLFEGRSSENFVFLALEKPGSLVVWPSRPIPQHIRANAIRGRRERAWIWSWQNFLCVLQIECTHFSDGTIKMSLDSISQPCSFCTRADVLCLKKICTDFYRVWELHSSSLSPLTFINGWIHVDVKNLIPL